MFRVLATQIRKERGAGLAIWRTRYPLSVPYCQGVKKILFLVVALNLSALTSAQAAPRYVSPVQGCTVHFTAYHHNYPATDILTKVGCSFVAPTAGVVDEVNRVDRFTWKTEVNKIKKSRPISRMCLDTVGKAEMSAGLPVN